MNLRIVACAAMLTLAVAQQLAYESVSPGFPGNFLGGTVLGLDFDVLEPVLVFELGTFIGTLPTLPQAAPPIQVGIFDRATQELVASANISQSTITRFSDSTALVYLHQPVLLPAGTYSVAAVGYSSSVQALTFFGSRNASRMVATDDCPNEVLLGGTFATFRKVALRFVGSSRRGPSGEDSLVFPITADLGPEARYAAGTFTFGLAACSLPWTSVTRSAHDFRTALLSVQKIHQENVTFPIGNIVQDKSIISNNVLIQRNTINASLEVDLTLMNSSASGWFVTIADSIFLEGSSLRLRGFSTFPDSTMPPVTVFIRGNVLREADFQLSGYFPIRTTIVIENNTKVASDYSISGAAGSRGILLDGLVLMAESALVVARNVFVMNISASKAYIAGIEIRGLPLVFADPVAAASATQSGASTVLFESDVFNLTQLRGGLVAGIRSISDLALSDGSVIVVRNNVFRMKTRCSIGPAGTVTGVSFTGQNLIVGVQAFLVTAGNLFDLREIGNCSQLTVFYITSATDIMSNSAILFQDNNVMTPTGFAMNMSNTGEMVRVALSSVQKDRIDNKPLIIVASNSWTGGGSSFIGFGWSLLVLCNSWNDELITMFAPLPSVTTDSRWLCPSACFHYYAPGIDCSLDPVVIGMWTGFQTYGDSRILDSMYAIQDGVASATHAVNRAGGIHGRPLSLNLCESHFNVDLSPMCVDRWASAEIPVVATLGIVTSTDFNAVMPKLIEYNMFLVNPVTPASSANRPYDQHWVYLRPPVDNIVTVTLKKMVRELHLKRIGFVFNTLLDVSPFQPIVDSLVLLGVNFTGWFGIDPNSKGGIFSFIGPAYSTWLAARPQAILVFSTPAANVLAFLLDFVYKSAAGVLVDPNVKIFTWDGFIQVMDIVIPAVKAAYPHYSLENRIYYAFTGPAIGDASFVASENAASDLNLLHKLPNYVAQKGTSYTSISMASWVSLRALSEMLRALPLTNVTSAALVDSVFRNGLYAVDDLLFGVFTSPCTGSRSGDSLVPCGCNQGYNAVELYRYTVSADGLSDIIREGAARITVPLSSCGVDSAGITAPLIYLLINAVDGSRSNISSSSILLNGHAVREASTIPPPHNPASVETVVANISRIVSAVYQTINDRLVSVAFCPVEQSRTTAAQPQLNPPRSVALNLPFIDTFTVPARLHPATFAAHWLVLSATLQQEIFALCEYITLSLNQPIKAIVRSSEAADIATEITKSANTFGVQPNSIELVDPEEADLHLEGVGDSALLLIGALDEDASLIAAHLERNARSIVLLAFSELCAMYDTLTALNLPQGVGDRIVFATSMRNWNAPSWPSNQASSLMTAFFRATTNSSSTPRHPLTLRGFIASAALAQVASQMTEAFTPSNVLRAWYALSVVQLGQEDQLGSFSRSPCYNELDTLCETNTGARIVRVLSLALVSQTSGNATDYYLSTTAFASGRISYRVLTQASSISKLTIAGIAIGSFLGLAAIVGTLTYFKLASRNNRYAPKDPDKPFTIIFTDIQSSTNLWAAVPETMANALEVHHELIRRLIGKYHCYEVKTIGDAFMVACTTAEQAAQLSYDLQHLFFRHDWGSNDVDRAYLTFEQEKQARQQLLGTSSWGEEVGGALQSGILATLGSEAYRSCWNGIRVRVGFHTGSGEIKLDEVTKGYDYYGTVSNVAARTESTASGGQVLMTRASYDELVVSDSKLLNELTIRSLGKTSLKGVPDPVELFELVTIQEREFPALQPEDAAVPVHSGIEDSVATSNHPSVSVSAAPQARVQWFSFSESETSSASSDGQLAPHGASEWSQLAATLMNTLFSVLSATFRKSVLEKLCQRWNVHDEHHLAQPDLIDVLARRIGGILKRKLVLPKEIVPMRFTVEQNHQNAYKV